MFGAQSPPPQGIGSGQWGSLEILLDYFALLWDRALVTPRIAIDGYWSHRPWGRHSIPLLAGEHWVRVCYPTLFGSEAGPAQCAFAIYPGTVTMVRYDAPFFRFSNGTIRVVNTRPIT